MTAARGNWTTRIAALVSLAVSGALLVVLYRSLDIRLVAETLLRADPWWLVISVGMIVPITFLRALRFYWVAPPGALPGIGRSVPADTGRLCAERLPSGQGG